MPRQTVFVTGATGFIAKHIVLQLLNEGYKVVGSVRSLSRGDEVRAAIAPHLQDASASEKRLRFVELDLTRDDGWHVALQGADVLMHTASPFPMTQPDDENEVIGPAVDGALRALRAAKAAGIGRVILTSSVVAIDGAPAAGQRSLTEADWTDIDRPGATAYNKSKTLAEQAAWDFVASDAPGINLTTINPALVLGPPLDRHYGTSVALVERLLRGKDPMVPKFGFSVVDVRDVAAAHLRAMERPESAGKRIIVADRFAWMYDMADTLKEAYPDRRIVTRRAPNALVRLLALFDKAVASIVPILGQRVDLDNARARTVLGLEFIPAEEAVRASANWLIRNTDI